MRVVHLSHADCTGGAAIAAYRLHVALQREQVDSHMLVQDMRNDNSTVHTFTSKRERMLAKLRPSLDKLPLGLYRKRRRTTFSCDWLPSHIPQDICKYRPDILNLHWIGAGYLRLESLSNLRFPQVWTLHDMWAFTGGCHYDDGCDGYRKSCGRCPQLGSNHYWDLSRWIWYRKSRTYRQLPLTIVCPSNWLAQCAKSSSLFNSLDIRIIPNGVDCQQYRPIDQHLARQLLGLSADKQLILFGAMSATSDYRKGFHLLEPALRRLQIDSWENRVEILIFGASKSETPIDLKLPIRYLGCMYDDLSLSLTYSAADVFVIPSMQDNFPNTALEAISCGIPCVAFNIGGLSDIITHQLNGYLAEPFSSADLANGISWVLQNTERYRQLSANARVTAEKKFTLAKQARSYQTLYEEVLKYAP
ncbi:MAG: glycosyltransferase [Leptolyngbya sp. SIOISBB]|nr:glycosyltransferase [Leptolyngbya sp. SIOISBB]